MVPQPDSRFARLQTDPRFRRPKQKNLKVEIDERFRDVLESEEFGGKGKGKGKGAARVDKRGRPLTSSHHSDQLKHFYRLRSPSPTAESSEKGFIDYARGEGVLESSGSEGGSDDESEGEEEELEIGTQKRVARHALPDLDSESDSDGSHLDVDLSEDEENQTSAFPPEADGGEEDEEEEEEEYADPTKRIAAVNLDWDNLRAADLYSIFNSFLKPSISKNGESSQATGQLLHVKIYPSEFGKGRMAKEELEGPGGGIFISKPGDRRKGKGRSRRAATNSYESEDEKDEEEDEEDEEEIGSGSDDEEEDDDIEADDFEDEDDGSDDEEEVRPSRASKGPKEIDGLEIVSDLSDAGEDDIDMDQLRQYQLERLRYFYAIATFSTVDAAMKVLSECNGTEFERTANMFDLSYVPDGMEFEEEDVKDEATKELKGYKGNDFVTDALRHSKVKLTWDQDDPNRIKVTRRNLTREEIEDEDFKAYLASSGSESEDEGPITDGTKELALADKKESKKASAKERTDKLRALLLNGENEDGDVWGKAGLSNDSTLPKQKVDGDVEITFRPGLSSNNKVDEENLTSLEKYQMRMKEKKARKKEKLELKRAAKEEDAPAPKSNQEDDFFGEDDSEDDDKLSIPDVIDDEEEPEADLHEDLVGKQGKGVEHFSMKDILKAEKADGKKKRKRVKKNKKGADEREVELGSEGWKINVQDERFKALHEEPEFAIDPSNPHFTKTKAMQDLLAERAKRSQKHGDREPVEKKLVSIPSNGASEKEKDLDALVQSVKRKMGEGGKKRKRSKK